MENILFFLLVVVREKLFCLVAEFLHSEFLHSTLGWAPQEGLGLGQASWNFPSPSQGR